jgi:hypothetical protein
VAAEEHRHQAKGRSYAAPAIMAEFAETFAKAEGLLAERPLRTALTDQEIARLADWHYAIVLSTDEAFTPRALPRRRS